MKRRDVLLSAGAAALAMPVATPAAAATLTSVNVTEGSSFPYIRPDWPRPREPNQVLYLQRSSNPNVVVWTAVYDQAGNLGAPPAQVYWRRYAEGGGRKGLKPFERRMAFGLNIRKGQQAGQYTITTKALPQYPFLLVQTGPNQSQCWCRIAGRNVLSDHAFVVVDESGLIPKVTDLHVYGRDPRSGTALSEHFRVSGGTLG